MADKNALYDLGIATMLQDPVPLELKHLFCDGLYGRIIKMPRRTVVMTAIHKRDNITVVMTGKCRVVKPDGKQEIITAPAYFVTPAGTQRAVYIERESVWLTAHATNAKTVEDAECDLAEMPDFFKDFISMIEQEHEQELIS